MTAISLQAAVSAQSIWWRMREVLTHREEYGLVWYAVAAIVLFALGVTALLGAIVWCSLKGKMFGAVYQKSSFTWMVGCH